MRTWRRSGPATRPHDGEGASVSRSRLGCQPRGRHRSLDRWEPDGSGRGSYGLAITAVAGEGRMPRSRLAGLLIAATAHATRQRLDLHTCNGDDFLGTCRPRPRHHQLIVRQVRSDDTLPERSLGGADLGRPCVSLTMQLLSSHYGAPLVGPWPTRTTHGSRRLLAACCGCSARGRREWRGPAVSTPRARDVSPERRRQADPAPSTSPAGLPDAGPPVRGHPSSLTPASLAAAAAPAPRPCPLEVQAAALPRQSEAEGAHQGPVERLHPCRRH